jgi:non-canonical (house-cleaning) NTP pyrophosphatase
MLAAIGSTNPVKLAAAKAVPHRLYGDHIDDLTGLAGTSNHYGAIGALTQGWLTRRQAFEQVLTLVFSRLLSPHFYT